MIYFKCKIALVEKIRNLSPKKDVKNRFINICHSGNFLLSMGKVTCVSSFCPFVALINSYKPLTIYKLCHVLESVKKVTR